ncbi:MAG: periplasmic heavy metal sensor [Desulfobacterales bacterium]|jgi:Spy/CpxP family protein refolding chaperone
MNFNKTGKILMVLAIAAVLAISVTSFAGWGRGQWGYGHHMGPGYGMHRGWGGGPSGYGGYGYQSGLSDEDMARLDKERRAFFEATDELREELYQKELELRSELAKPEPDAKKAAGLQKEISNLEGQLDQKRLDQQIKMRKDFPRFGYRSKGYGRGGWGMGRGMYGGGGYGGGNCWN